MHQVLTIRRHRFSSYIRERFSDDTRSLRPGFAPDEYRVRPHSGQTMLSQRSEQQQEENCQDRTGTTA
jgi:hypothetical protein